MKPSDLQKLQNDESTGAAAKASLAKYVQSFFPALYAAFKRHQSVIDAEFPEYWSGTVHGDDHLVQMFDRLDGYKLTDAELHIRMWECFRNEYDYKDAVFPRVFFDETDTAKREVLIEAHFAALVEAKRTEYRKLKAEEQARSREEHESLQ